MMQFLSTTQHPAVHYKNVFSRKLSELGSRLDFGVQGLAAASGLPPLLDARKRAFRLILSEVRPCAAGPVSEVHRHGLSEGLNEV
jgi:hypothetical protein